MALLIFKSTKHAVQSGALQSLKISVTFIGHDSFPFPAGSTPLFDNGFAVKKVHQMLVSSKVDADIELLSSRQT